MAHVKTDDVLIYDYEEKANMQIYYSRGIELHGKRLKDKYGLADYTDVNKPCLFYGFFFTSDWHKCLNHKGKRIALWSGSDALGRERLRALTAQKDILHIATGHYLFNDLEKYTDNIIQVPKINTPIDYWKPKPLGDKIYWCNSQDVKYGRDYGQVLVDHFGVDKFLFTESAAKQSCTLADMPHIYEQCFMGLRLTKRDGSPNTVHELGLMGRMVVSNSRTPNCLNYNTVYDIIQHIEDCMNPINDEHEQVAKQVYEYLDVNLIEKINEKLGL